MAKPTCFFSFKTVVHNVSENHIYPMQSPVRVKKEKEDEEKQKKKGRKTMYSNTHKFNLFSVIIHLKALYFRFFFFFFSH